MSVCPSLSQKQLQADNYKDRPTDRLADKQMYKHKQTHWQTSVIASDDSEVSEKYCVLTDNDRGRKHTHTHTHTHTHRESFSSDGCDYGADSLKAYDPHRVIV